MLKIVVINKDRQFIVGYDGKNAPIRGNFPDGNDALMKLNVNEMVSLVIAAVTHAQKDLSLAAMVINRYAQL